MPKNKNYYYSESEWDRLGCGPLPEDRDLSKLNKTEGEKQSEAWLKNEYYEDDETTRD